MQKPTNRKEAHTSPSPRGMGDNYGSAVKHKIGRMREDSMGNNSVPQKKLSKPPKSIA